MQRLGRLLSCLGGAALIPGLHTFSGLLRGSLSLLCCLLSRRSGLALWLQAEWFLAESLSQFFEALSQLLSLLGKLLLLLLLCCGKLSGIIGDRFEFFGQLLLLSRQFLCLLGHRGSLFRHRLGCRFRRLSCLFRLRGRLSGLSPFSTGRCLLTTLSGFGRRLSRRRIGAQLLGRVDRHLCRFRSQFLLLCE